jgi:phospholipase/carboxylesterase
MIQSSSYLSHIHRFEPGTASCSPLLLLHGTGGNEDDLLSLGRTVAPGASLLSPRGQVLENGMPRFFRRLAEGVFDFADVHRRAQELADFVIAARRHYRVEQPIALGYSNGANIAAALLLLRPEVLAGAVLLRAMVPLPEQPETAGSSDAPTPVLIISGRRDPIVPLENAEGLTRILKAKGMSVDHHIIEAGHQLAEQDVKLSAQWLDSFG